ncbi:MAG: hypothetical protein OZ921_15915 [Sorangiineae bacterium]|nr:hypothetical protein [Polyangiaceae bacterium]MEB2323999.1 hypothetical protein [Sorangiineae bacterium]
MASSGLWKAVKQVAGVDPSAIRVRDDFVRDEFGSSAHTRVRDALSPPLRALVMAANPPPGYVDFALFLEMNVVIDRLLGAGDLELVPRMGRYAARQNAGAWQTLFSKTVDIPTFMGIAGGLWHKHYDSGSLIQRRIGESQLEIELRNFAAPHRAHCMSVVGWLEGIFELSPSNRVVVTEPACRASDDDQCLMVLEWSDAAPGAG